MVLALIPNLNDKPPSPDSYGIRCASDGKWEAVLCGEVIARRNTAPDAAAVILGFDEPDTMPKYLDGITVSDMIGAAAIEQDQIAISHPAALLSFLALSVLAIIGAGWIAWAVVSQFIR